MNLRIQDETSDTRWNWRYKMKLMIQDETDEADVRRW